MLRLDFDFSIFDFLTSKKVLLVSQNISSAFLLFFFWFFFSPSFKVDLYFFLGCKICVGRDFFRLIFTKKKLIFFLQNPKKRTRYIHEIFAVFQNNFRILSNVFASSKSQILVREDFLLLFFSSIFWLLLVTKFDYSSWAGSLCLILE